MIIPTYNEAVNVGLLIERLDTVLNGIDHEIVVVDDDSPDLTWEVVERIGVNDPRVRLLRRFDRQGLSSAIIAGLLEARGGCLLVMDGDLQHDEAILPDMFRQIVDEGFDVCVGSREAAGGSYGRWSASRKLLSLGARRLAHLMVDESVQDPMSGYFALSRDYFRATLGSVNPRGFKVLLEFLARGRAPKVSEVGYTFRPRIHGETKLDASVALGYLLALADLRFGWLIPTQSVNYSLVGLSGSLIGLFGFALTQAAGASVPISVVVGVELAILWTCFGSGFLGSAPTTSRGRNFLPDLALHRSVCCRGLLVQLSVVHLLLGGYPSLQLELLTLYPVYMASVAFAALGDHFPPSYCMGNRPGLSMAVPRRSFHRVPPPSRTQPK